MDSIEAKIGYHFVNPGLLTQALTHPSLACETKQAHPDNQRLEFLGDAVIQLIFTEDLYTRLPESGEGDLTKIRSRLVSRKALTLFANHIDLGRHLQLGRGEIASGGRRRSSNLGDAFEALAGAIYLDSNLDTVRTVLFKTFQPVIEAILNEKEESNPKGLLQEFLQAIAPSSPSYHIVSQDGPDHRKHFVAEVHWEQLVLGQGSGGSKKEAEFNAASEALQQRLWESPKTCEELVNKSENP